MRNLDAGAEIRKISANENLPIYPTMLNVDHDDSVREGFAKIVGQHGPIDILVNNAGIGGGGAVEETPLDVFREVMETNFFGGLRCIKTVITSMRNVAGEQCQRHHGPPRVALGQLCRIEMGLRGAERVPRSGNARFQRPRRDCGARGHRHSDLHKSAPSSAG
jgi:NAD(P)-dependent dehydrogenase (short-subunit alcohol dehydrogenase family)